MSCYDLIGLMTSLIVKTFLGFALLMSVLGLALIVSAGSLRFWQAWVYLAVFAICTLLITVYLFRNDPTLLASRVQVGAVEETRRSQQVIQGFASIFFIALFIVPGLDFRFGWSVVPPIVSLVSDGFVALPLPLPLILLVARRLLNEEKFLAANLSGYQQYRQRVPYRLMPYLW